MTLAARHPAIARLGLAFASVLLVVLAAELVLRIIGPPVWYVVGADHDTLMTPHPVRGYQLKPGLDRSWSRKDWTIRVHFNELGMRAPPVAELRSADVRVLAVGDSFTMGIGVEAAETWSAQLERILIERMFPNETVRVANAGVPGYSTRQMRLTIEELVPVLDPQLVILAFYASSHWRIQDPYAVLGEQLVSSSTLPYLDLGTDGSVVYSPFEGEGLRRIDIWLKRHFFVGARALSVAGRVMGAARYQWSDYEHVPEDELPRAHEGALAEILAARDEVAAMGIPFVVLLINRQEADGSFLPREAIYNRIVGDFCREHGIPAVDPLTELVDRSAGKLLFAYPRDIHWTPAAHRVAAEQLFDLLEKRELLHRGARAIGR